jgi:hypothetical protein
MPTGVITPPRSRRSALRALRRRLRRSSDYDALQVFGLCGLSTEAVCHHDVARHGARSIAPIRVWMRAAPALSCNARKVTQAQLAKLLGTSQPRVAAMEAGDPQTSLEALLRALIVLGATPTLKVA